MNPERFSMLALLGVPTFSLVLGPLFISALVALVFGLSKWRQTKRKVIAIIAGLVLLAFAVVAICVLLTVWSGSMG